MTAGNYSPGVDLISQERARQIEEEGYTPEHDHNEGPDNLAMAGAIYAVPSHLRGTSDIVRYWPWGMSSFKPTREDRLRELAKAGALIAAEMDDILANGYYRDGLAKHVRDELMANPLFRAAINDAVSEQDSPDSAAEAVRDDLIHVSATVKTPDGAFTLDF